MRATVPNLTAAFVLQDGVADAAAVQVALLHCSTLSRGSNLRLTMAVMGWWFVETLRCMKLVRLDQQEAAPLWRCSLDLMPLSTSLVLARRTWVRPPLTRAVLMGLAANINGSRAEQQFA